MGAVQIKLSNKKQPLKTLAQITLKTKQTKMTSRTMITFSCIIAANLRTSLGSVAIGAGTRNPENANECLDPDTGLNHTIGAAWSLPGVCGEAHCEVRGESIYISYAFCGSAHAEYPCYLSAETDLPYPYCCPRSFCPSNLDIETNEIDTDYYDDELQMAAIDIDNSYDSEEYQIDWDTLFGVPDSNYQQ